MGQAAEGRQDAITGEEISGTLVPRRQAEQQVPRQIDAFASLMSPRKSKNPPASAPKTSRESRATATTTFLGRDGLGAYIASPQSFPASRVISHTEKIVTINDLYPKSSVHLLLLPRDSKKASVHPFEALADKQFLEEVQSEVKKLRELAAKELRRRYGKSSRKEQVREEAMNKEPMPDLPPGRDWTKEIVAGVHAHPSMRHLHIHIISVDRVSDCMRHRKHYNSFATPFFVPIDDFPLAANDKRRHPGREGYLDSDLRCWRCGKNFGNKFARLKDHLAEEFEVWKKE